MFEFLKKIFGSHQERMIKKMQPTVDKINEWYEYYLENISTEEQIKEKTEEFRNRLDEGETEADLMCEAFGLVKRTCKYLVDNDIISRYTGNEEKWYMVPYDVQLYGAIVIHNGNIAEMATGEGKTLVATMPAYLNSLRGNVHIVTVNDYLARRDSQWMSVLYNTLGVSVNALQGEMDTSKRKEVYNHDIVYGTNSQFGFDYLRDNMVGSVREQVQKYRDFVIIDEVDSILIDEARTPLIISGPVETKDKGYYRNYNPKVRKLVRTQRDYVSNLVKEGKKKFDEGKEEEAGRLFLIAHRGLPKHKQLMKLKQDPKIKKLIKDIENRYMREKQMHLIDEQLYYTIEEKKNVADLTDKGRELLSPENPELFRLEDIGEKLADIDEKDISEKEKEKQKRNAQKEYAEKSEILHSISQLLKAYSLFRRDVDYVVKDNKVQIVDEYTGRLMPGRRFSEGLHEALEAKEEVKIEGETQTFATITLQNFFRLYNKISGMTGTAVTEEGEFKEIYDMDVAVIPTNEPVRRIDYEDVIYKSKKEKFDAVIEEIIRSYKRGIPVLVGTISVEDSELLARMLKRRGITASVLNAKNHAKEAEIVAQAGQKKSVTIATNMAGRGTDIKLGESVRYCDECYIKNDREAPDEIDIEECKEDMPCGLYVIGTQRHESRRIDRQLRGRSGRQGDPGASRFFVSLEDKLMRLFGSDKIIGLLERVNMEEGQAIQHPLLSRQIEKAQQKVEQRNFEIRKHTLEYDDVINKQRSVIYDNRNFILETAYIKEFFDHLENNLEFESLKKLKEYVRNNDRFEKIVINLLQKYNLIKYNDNNSIKLVFKDVLKKEIEKMIKEVIEIGIDTYCDESMRKFDWDFQGLSEYIFEYFTLDIDFDPEKIDGKEDLLENINEAVQKLYEKRRELMGEDLLIELERVIMLRNYDNHWREHLYAMDDLKEGINLRAYAQKDPLIEYKRESFEMFKQLNEDIEKSIVRDLFHMVVEKESEVPEDETDNLIYITSGNDDKDVKQEPVKKDKDVGRNDPCPCGSGRKYKNCCWPKYEN